MPFVSSSDSFSLFLKCFRKALYPCHIFLTFTSYTLIVVEEDSSCITVIYVAAGLRLIKPTDLFLYRFFFSPSFAGACQGAGLLFMITGDHQAPAG